MKKKSLITGILWMVIAQLLFVVAWTTIKFLGTRLPLFEIVFFRGFLSLFILVPLTWWHLRTFRGCNLLALFLRSIFGFVAMVMAFYAMIHMDIGNAATLFNTLPIFVALFAPAILGESFSKRKLILIMVAFAGIGMILKPDLGIFGGASILALVAGLLGAMAMLFVRKLAATDSPIIITLYFTVLTAVAAAPPAAMNFVFPTPMECLFLSIIAVCVTIAQLLMAKSYQYDHASTIAPFSYTSVIGSYVVGLSIFGEIPDAWSIIGAAVIIAGGIGIMLSQPKTPSREEIRSAKVT